MRSMLLIPPPSSPIHTTRLVATPQVVPAAYKLLLECVESGDINVCDKVPSGAKTGGAKMINPVGATGHQVTGADRFVWFVIFS